MGESNGFLKYSRGKIKYRPIQERLLDFDEMALPLTPDVLNEQAGRCMDCGIPFCHGMGCPLGNRIPEFNEMVWEQRWQQACDVLHSTNNFPEFTGRVCPAPCETACTLGVSDEPVMIRHIELQIVEKGFEQGWIKPKPAGFKTGKKVAVIGSGPAGLAAAQQLARAGHDVTVFEKDERPGGLLRYGIPDFKMSKSVIDRRLEQLKIEGVSFQTGIKAGEDISAGYLRKRFDCVLLAMGAGKPRDLAVPGRGFENVMYAMDYLSMQNKICGGESVEELVTARDKSVVVIGGGDTGSDCVGTARRQGAREVYQLEILPKPPVDRPVDTPWPMWPRIMRHSTSHEEGCERYWSVSTKQLTGDDRRVRELIGCKVEWLEKNGKWQLEEKSGSEFTLKADLVLLAMGFLHVVHDGLVSDLGLQLDGRGNIQVENSRTNIPWVFGAGDTVSGASLVVRAIESGREAARVMDEWLKNDKN